MIPFASQRGNGQDLATHLQNAQDNELVELFEMRRSVARDLHGAFAEWEAIANGLTRARQYLCSLSVNPDERQGRLTRAQYLDYIDRVEAALRLTGQPRAIVFHHKRSEDGMVREHCHVVWSRTDVKNKRAIPLPFFKEKLMAVTREFARDHGLRLPPGYDRQGDEARRNRQLSAYDCVKQNETGLSHEERMAAVTDAWQRSDTAKAFVAALEALGYVLARGRNETRIVLVDFYGHTTALTRLIDDPTVRAKHVRDFLGTAFAPDKLPSVDQAQDQAAKRRATIEVFEAAAHEDEEAEQLARRQAARREEAEAHATILRRQHRDERAQLAALHMTERQRLKASYLAAQRRIRMDRARRRPRGLAAFLGKVSGVSLVIRKVQRYRDRKRYAAYLLWRNELKRQQKESEEALAMEHGLQMADVERRLRALDQIGQRERESVEQMRRSERCQRINARHEHMPAVIRGAAPQQQGTALAPRVTAARQMAEAAQLLKDARKPVSLSSAFARAAAAATDDGEGDSGETGTAEPFRTRKRKPRVRDRISLQREFKQAASGEQAEGEAGSETSEAPKPVIEPPREKRRRRKRKPRDGPGADDRRNGRDGHERPDDPGETKSGARRRPLDTKPSQ
jgi:hypothetical protein